MGISFQYTNLFDSKKGINKKSNLHKNTPITNYTSYRAELFSSIHEKRTSNLLTIKPKQTNIITYEKR